MLLKIIIFFYLCTWNLFGSDISYKTKEDFKKLNIENGKIEYFKDIGYGIGFKYSTVQLTEQIDLFLDFNDKNNKHDRTLNYKIKNYTVKIVPSMKLNNSLAGGFILPSHKIVIQVKKKNFLANSKDLGSFYIDFFIYPNIDKNSILLKKGIFYDNKFYGITIEFENKRVVVKLKNLFYNENGKTYSFSIKTRKILKIKSWQHIGFVFKRTKGKLSLYLDGKLEKEKFATSGQTSTSEILTPRFLKFDGSDLVLFKNFLGYCDNFRIGTSANIDFKKYINAILEKVTITSPVIDLKYINSQIQDIVFKIKDHNKGLIQLFFKYGNTFNDTNMMKWGDEALYLINKDTLVINNFNLTAKYIQWKAVLRRNPIEKDVPAFYYFNVKYRENFPPLSPVNIKILEYNNKIKLSWDENLEEDLKGYIIYWGRQSEHYENKVDIGLKNSYIIDSLQAMQNYYFSIKAYDSKKPYNLSEFSKEVHLFKK